MKRLMFMALLLSPLCIGLCAAETATFVYKNGKVDFGEFKRMTADSVYLDMSDNGGNHKNAAIAKSMLSEVVFDSGDKLNLALSEFPHSSSLVPSTTAQTKQVPAHVASPSAVAAPALIQAEAVEGLRNPFTYGGLSAIVPGLGQALQGEYVKGAVSFAVVGVSLISTMAAWNSTTAAYNTVQQTQAANGSYNNTDYQRFTFRLHGAQILSCLSGVLYLLNIADATTDAVIFNKQLRPGVGKLSLTVFPHELGCDLAFTF